MTEIAHGLRDVVLTETRLSMIDGEAGRLLIGGFPVEELAPKASYEEVLYLLWHDRLPNGRELETFEAEMAAHRSLPEATLTVLQAAADHRLPPMDALRMGVDTLSLVDPNPADTSKEANLERALRLVARFPTVVAAYWRLLHGERPLEPDPKLGHAENFLSMLKGDRPHAAAVRGLQTYLNTVIDHGMNASTFTARVIASTRSDMISAIVGAVGALKGPRHGGAPGPAMNMVFEIRDKAERSGRSVAEEAKEWADAALSRGELLMGFGHRVYRVRDPRADVLGRAAVKLFEEAGDTGLFEDAKTIEEVMLRALENHKPGRSIQTNVEFYTALLLHGVGLDADLFSPVFAVSRVGGWTAHVLEGLEEDELIRPSALYRGAWNRSWPTKS